MPALRMTASPTDWLEKSSRDRPGDLAVADVAGRLSYAELHGEASSVAAALRDAGVGPGDPVAIDLPPGVGHAVALHGAVLAGAVVQSLPRSGRDGVDVAPGAAFADGEVVAAARGADRAFEPVSRDPSEPLTRVLSSGTSGEPKPIALTASNHHASALASARRLGTVPQDLWLCCLPLNHVGGMTILIRSVIYGTAALIHDGFDADRVGEALESGGVTIASLVSTQLVRLLDAGARVERPRVLVLGGGPVPPDVLAEALGRGATVVQTYGLTEACSQVCTLAPDEAVERVGSAGRPLSGTEVAVVDEEILVRGPTVAPASIAADGWLHTGDLGRLDADGYLWVEGRRSDLIVTGGENVRPQRVEAAIGSHPGVADVAVIGREDREWGQAVVAVIVPESGGAASDDELIAHARLRLEPFEVPKRIERVGELPRTPSGKVVRRLLSDL